MIRALSEIGGIFALLVFVHFAIDWIFQSHDEAMAKPTNWRVRSRHCAVYSVPFAAIFWWLAIPMPWAIGCWALLFLSHFVEDTYIPVWFWAVMIRKPPELQRGADREAFKAFAETPLGKILLIAVDQIVHIAFLLPVAWVIWRFR